MILARISQILELREAQELLGGKIISRLQVNTLWLNSNDNNKCTMNNCTCSIVNLTIHGQLRRWLERGGRQRENHIMKGGVISRWPIIRGLSSLSKQQKTGGTTFNSGVTMVEFTLKIWATKQEMKRHF